MTAKPLTVWLTLAIAWTVADEAAARASEPNNQTSTPLLCGQPVPPPARLPPADSGPVVYVLGLCFSPQGNASLVDPSTYLHYVNLKPSRPSLNEWVPFDDEAVDAMKADFRRLWATNFLDDIRIESADYVFANGVIGRLVTYHLEERQRVKMVTYEGSKQLDRDKLEAELRERGIELRLDSFLDASTLGRIKAHIRQMLAEKGFVDAQVTHTISALAGEPKLVNVTFRVDNGPKLMIRDVEFIGNTAMRDSTLERALKDNRPQDLLSFFTHSGSYKETKFAEDAQRLEDYYRDRGYLRARVGEPQVRPLDDSPDGTIRWIQVRIPVTEGAQYRVGSFAVDGNRIVGTDGLSRLFKVKAGDVYSQKAIREGLEKAREAYGASGYMEFTGFPDLMSSDAAVEGGHPVVDVTLRVSEGAQYVVNRITFTGNTTTRDNVIRREMQLVEGGVFNTEALKNSVRRLNQLGYFKPLEGTDKDLSVEKALGRENAVDVSLNVQEQNRNQMTFGAGVSQYEGLFGNLAFTTANFLGRGESLTISAQKGQRASNYQLSFTEPFLFDRPLSAGFDLFSRKVDYLSSANVVGYSEVREGADVTVGRSLFRFSRMFVSYGYEIINAAASDDFSSNGSFAVSASPLYTAFLGDGRHTESRVTPSIMHNTVDNPFMPHRGMKVTASLPVAGGFLGGTSNYLRPEVETVLYIPHTRRTALGLRANAAWIQPFGDTRALPYYLRFFLGGEYQIRGVDIRTVGPTDAQGRAVGGNKFVLFNAEYYFDLFGPVRALLFHDTGQAFQERHPIDLRQLRTSSGMEVRFMVPMLNVPFRLIYAWNVYRDSFQPARSFKFAVGTTF